jgi:hypothetical protein
VAESDPVLDEEDDVAHGRLLGGADPGPSAACSL